MQVKVSSTSSLPCPNPYVLMLQNEFAQWAYDEARAPQFKGLWRHRVFAQPENCPMDLEIGTGNGFHFAHYAKQNPERLLVGIELKYKPLIQSIRRTVKDGDANARIARYDAAYIEDLFADGELNNILIHFPDPWERKRQWKNRLIDDEFLFKTHRLQRPAAKIDFKTDSIEYFEWALERMKKSPYEIVALTRDLHRSEWAEQNFLTHFEKLFMSQGLKINYVQLQRKD